MTDTKPARVPLARHIDPMCVNTREVADLLPVGSIIEELPASADPAGIGAQVGRRAHRPSYAWTWTGAMGYRPPRPPFRIVSLPAGYEL